MIKLKLTIKSKIFDEMAFVLNDQNAIDVKSTEQSSDDDRDNILEQDDSYDSSIDGEPVSGYTRNIMQMVKRKTMASGQFESE